MTGTSAAPLASRIVRASALILLAHVVFKFLGLVQSMIVGRVCDTMTVELFIFGYDHILLLLFLIGEEAIAPVLLPLFMETRQKLGEAPAWKLAGTVISWQCLLAVAATALLMLWPGLPLLFSGWDKPEYLAAAPGFIRWLAASILLMSVTTSTYMLLNGYKRFFLAALGDAAIKAGIIGGLLAGAAYAHFAPGGRAHFTGDLALTALAGGVFAGCALKVATHLWGLRREIRHFRPGLALNTPLMRRFLWLMAPLLAGILFAKFRDFYNNYYLLSGLEEGLVKANSFGGKIFKSAGTLVPYAVSIALLPYFCEMVDRGRRDELARTIDTSSRLLFLFFLPVAALLAVVSMPLTMVLFGGGRFSYADCEWAALSNACYVWVLPFYALEYVFMQAFFSQRKTAAVVAIGIATSALMILANTAGVLWLGWSGEAALALIALSYLATRAGKVVWLGLRLRRSVECFAGREAAGFVLRTAGVALATGLAAWLAREAYEAFYPLAGALPDGAASPAEGGGRLARLAGMLRTAAIPLGSLCFAGGAGVAAALLSAWLLARGECRLALDYLRQRLRRGRAMSDER